MNPKSSALLAMSLSLILSATPAAQAATKTQVASDFAKQGVEKVLQDPVVSAAGKTGKLKSAASAFATKITGLLLLAKNNKPGIMTVDEATQKMMGKASGVYSAQMTAMASGKSWASAADAFIKGLLTQEIASNPEAKIKIEEATRNHFEKMSVLLAPASETPETSAKAKSSSSAKTTTQKTSSTTTKTASATTSSAAASASTTTKKAPSVSISLTDDDEKDDEKTEGEGKEEKKDDFEWSAGLVGGEEEDKDVGDIEVTGGTIKELVIAGIKFKGNFIKQPNGDYLVQGEIKPDGFSISLGKAAGQLTVSKNQDRISGEMYISVPVYGKIIQITDFIIDKTKPQIKFKGKFEEKVTIPVVHADVSLAKGIADFEISTARLACQANGGIIIDIDIPKVGELSFEVISGSSGFVTSIPPEGLSVTGSGTVTIPFEPPIEVKLEGSAQITKKSLSGEGSASVFSMIEIANGTFDIGFNGIMNIDANVGAMLKDYGVEANVASTTMVIDLPKKRLNASLSQSIKILELITIPGSVKGDLNIDAKAKIIRLGGAAGIPLTGSAIGPEQLSAGIKNFLFEIKNYDSSARTTELNGDLYISVWTLAGFKGRIANTMLDGQGNLFLPPGLKQLLDIEKVSLPVKVDLKAGQILGDLGGDVAGLAIKHFPLEGPQIIVKNDGVHLKGQIGIANVITIPLGDLVFTKTSSATTLDADIGLGPLTLAEGKFILPENQTQGIGFNGKIDIPGLTGQKCSGSLYRDGRLEFTGLTEIGFIDVDSVGKFSVSKTGLHADTAKFGLGLGGAATCALTFNGLDITPKEISGTATGSFKGVLGIGTSLTGRFAFDGQQVRLTYPDAVSLCGISVRGATLTISPSGMTGSGQITLAGEKKNVSITLENGILRLKGPAGELIAEGMNIASEIKDTVVETASDEKEVIAEDADSVLKNLSRMSEPWIKDAASAAAAAKKFYGGIEKFVTDEVGSRAKAALNEVKNEADDAVQSVKSGINAAVDAIGDGINALVNKVQEIFAQIESLVPSQYSGTYQTIKNKIIQKATSLKQQVVSFRNNTKTSLYNLCAPIPDLYQSAINTATTEATRVAGGIKKEVDPMIAEVDLLLTEIGTEIRAAKNTMGEEAEKHYAAAKNKADRLKQISEKIIDVYKNKISDRLAPYTKPINEKIAAYKGLITRKRDEAVAKSVEDLKTAKATLDPYIQPFEDAVKELNDLLNVASSAAFQKFLQGIGAAGSALNTALGTAGQGLVKATDLLGDGVVAASNAAANASQTIHNAGAAATQAATQAAQQTYAAATQVYNAVQEQASSTVNTVISNLPSISPSQFTTGAPVSFSQIQSGAATVSAKINSIINTVSDYASSAASSAASTVSSGASTVASTVSSGWNAATNKISSLFGGGGGSSTPVLNYDAPEVTNIAATSTTNSITVTWDTSFSSRTLLFYSAQPNVNMQGAGNGTLVASIHDGDNYPETTHHSITVNNLNPGTPYYYVVYAVHAMTGGATNAAKKGPYSVITQPTTAIIGGLVKDAQNNPVTQAAIYLDNASTAAAITDATGQYALEVNPGIHTVIAKKNNYLTKSASTSSLAAGQILPLDFTLADGRIWISGSIKDSSSNAAIASATIKITGAATPINVSTDNNGAFTVVLGTTNGNSLSLTLEASKQGYGTYASGPMNMAAGSKAQNIQINLPKDLPALSGNIGITGSVSTGFTVSFITTKPCSAFIQFGPQTQTNYLYQTNPVSNMSAFTFNINGLTPGTAYKYRVVLQDDAGHTVIAKEGAFPTTASNTTTQQNTGSTTSPGTTRPQGRATAI